MDVVFVDVYPSYPLYPGYKYQIYELGVDPNEWYNVAFAKYYGLKSVRVQAVGQLSDKE